MNDFPLYRKLSNSKVFYKINSLSEFEEIQLVGSKSNYFRHQTSQYPEKLKIMDMIAMSDNSYILSTKEEWEHY